jgi:hypothetical protein
MEKSIGGMDEHGNHGTEMNLRLPEAETRNID